MYTLGSINLPNPKKFERRILEVAVEHLLMFGRSTKKLEHRKEQFILNYQYLSQEQVNVILSQYELDTVLDFTVTDEEVDIATTGVLMEVQGREYPASGVDYRENLTLVLTEVF